MKYGCIDAWVFYATEKLHTMLEEDGAIKALLAMVRSGNIDVIAQVARGLANFAKCESRAIVQGLFLLSFHKLYMIIISHLQSALIIILMNVCHCRTKKGPFTSDGRQCP